MKIDKKILLIFIIYIIVTVVFSGYKIARGGETYFNYKSVVNKAKEQLNKDKEQNAVETSSNEKDKSNVSTTEASQPTTNTTTSPTTDNTTATQKDEDYSNVKFTRVLAENSKGDDVKKLQYLLKKNKCYNGDITGIFDAATKQALIKFQKDNKLPADGGLGSVTSAKLEQ
ncbi:peptidoglycan-binding domain-containing protein [Clostridium omnivorum]|uniref:Peptidoglycan binding-like domain-containing protein n=1 Tax=Clostridium omnivorum TaxID=1604902 RepID=A0ABQ5N376_9CLOT|nr:peptidoglycan-binding domain-containing protein [Clostridium sp. E14]GLC29667.1 hypothetical protein bsdE14_10770 [Clostridium sp. E14]